MKDNNHIQKFNEHQESLNISDTDTSTRYLILSGEGGHESENQFVMELDTLEEANQEFEKFKSGEFDGTQLYIYEAKKIREE